MYFTVVGFWDPIVYWKTMLSLVASHFPETLEVFFPATDRIMVSIDTDPSLERSIDELPSAVFQLPANFGSILPSNV